MKFSSAAVTVAAISLLSATHAAPLGFKDGGIIGRPNHRRGSDLSDLSDVSDLSASRANKALEDLDVGFEPSNLILPRILNFIKRQVSADTATVSSSKPEAGQATGPTESTAGTADTDLHTTLMSPDLEDYGFASEGGPESALAPVREVKE